MDLSEKWPLEEGAWLSHAGIHHFANTRVGMAAFDVPDSHGTLQLLHSLCQPRCTQYVPGLFVFSKAARWWSQTALGSDAEFPTYRLCGLEKIYHFLSSNIRIRMPTS